MLTINDEMTIEADKLIHHALPEETKEVEPEFAIFVTNIPPLEEVTHTEFLKMFSESLGVKIKRYNIRRNTKTAVIKYFTMEDKRKALELNDTYTAANGLIMHVSSRQQYDIYQIAQLLKECKWEKAYNKLKIYKNLCINHLETVNESSHYLLLNIFAYYYELIAISHDPLFELLNEYADKNYQYCNAHRIEIPKILLLIQLRKDVWQFRTDMVTQITLDHAPISKDVIQHVLFKYFKQV